MLDIIDIEDDLKCFDSEVYMARNILDEEGKLDEDAGLYDADDKKIPLKQKFKNMTFKQKVQFYKDYYLKTTIIILIVIVMIIVSIKDYLRKDDVVLNIAVEDNAYSDADVTKMEEKLEKALGLAENQKVSINTDYNSTSYNSQQKLQTYLYSGTVDIVISSEKGYTNWSKSGYFMFPDKYDEVSFYKNLDSDYRFYSIYVSGANIRGDEKQDNKKYNYGLYIQDSKNYKKMGGVSTSKQVAGININSENVTYAVAAMKYLFENELK